MAISTRSRYAIRALVNLGKFAKCKKGEPVTIKEIAREQGLSGRYLETIFLLLGEKGYLKSVKGEKGGFKFAESPAKISLYDVILAVENKIGPVDCVLDSKICSRSKNCEMRKIWIGLAECMNKYLKDIKLARLIEKYSMKKGHIKKGPCKCK